MAFELQESTVISVCVDCVYFNAYGRLDDMSMEADPQAAEKHKAMIAGTGWPYGTEFTPGCGEACPDRDRFGTGGCSNYQPADPAVCKHCGIEIVPTTYGTWGDRYYPDYEVCDLSDDNGPSHEPELHADDNAEPEPWFSWSSCDQCGSRLGGDREHATAWTYRKGITRDAV